MNPITESPAEESIASVDPVASAIADELAFQRGQHKTLVQRTDAAQAQIEHLEKLLELRHAGPVIQVADPLDALDAEFGDEIEQAIEDCESEERDDDPEPARDFSPPTEPKKQKRTAADVIRPFALQLRDDEGTFTSKQLGQVLEDAGQPFSPPPISKLLKTLVEEGKLVQIAKGGPGKSAVWGDPENSDSASQTTSTKKPPEPPAVMEMVPEKARYKTTEEVRAELDAAGIDYPAAASRETLLHHQAAAQRIGEPASPRDLGPDTHTAKNGEDIDDIVFDAIDDDGPLEYHEILEATGESGVLVRAALSRLKAGHRVLENEGAYAVNPNQESAEPAAPGEASSQDLRKRIRAVLKAHNGASARKLSGLLRGVTDPEIAAELHRMQDEDIVNFYGITRQWKLIED